MVEQRWEECGDTLHLYFRPHQISEDVANTKMRAAVLAFGLAVHERACLHCLRQEVCSERARLEALSGQKGE